VEAAIGDEERKMTVSALASACTQPDRRESYSSIRPTPPSRSGTLKRPRSYSANAGGLSWSMRKILVPEMIVFALVFGPPGLSLNRCVICRQEASHHDLFRRIS